MATKLPTVAIRPHSKLSSLPPPPRTAGERYAGPAAESTRRRHANNEVGIQLGSDALGSNISTSADCAASRSTANRWTGSSPHGSHRSPSRGDAVCARSFDGGAVQGEVLRLLDRARDPFLFVARYGDVDAGGQRIREDSGRGACGGSEERWYGRVGSRYRSRGRRVLSLLCGVKLGIVPVGDRS